MRLTGQEQAMLDGAEGPARHPRFRFLGRQVLYIVKI